MSIRKSSSPSTPSTNSKPSLFEPVESRKELKGHLGWWLAWLGVTLLAALFLKPSPEGHGTHTQLGLPACGSVAFFGRPCPGCGLTTSWTATIHGQLQTAFEAHALGTLLYLVFSFSAFACMWGYITQRRFNDRYKPVAVMFALSLFSLVIYGVIRFFLVKYPGQGALL